MRRIDDVHGRVNETPLRGNEALLRGNETPRRVDAALRRGDVARDGIEIVSLHTRITVDRVDDGMAA